MSQNCPHNAAGLTGADIRRPEISMRFILPLINLLRRKHGNEKVDAVVREAGLMPSELNNPDGWVSMGFSSRLRDEIFRQLYGLEKQPPRDDPMWQLWRQAGREGFKRESMGNLIFLIRTFGSPGPLYRSMPCSIRRGSVGLEAEVLSYMPGRVIFSVTPRNPETYWEGHERCVGRIGCFEGIPQVWGLPLAKVQHSHCMHDPDNPARECRYIVTFVERPVFRFLSSFFIIAFCPLFTIVAKEFLFQQLSFEISIILNGLFIGLAIEAWRSALLLQNIQNNDVDNIRELLCLSDQRYMDLWRESNELRRLALHNRNISSYIPKTLLDRLRDRQQPPILGGSKREVTVVFVDIQNYSTVSEYLDPEQTIQILNKCFSAWVADVQAHGGTVLEFLGDGMLAVFGAPNDLANHPSQALYCLRAMISSMEQLNKSWSKSGLDEYWKRKNISQLGFRSGIHTGTVVEGNLGSLTQMKYAVVGDTVNVAARLEQLNKKLGSTIAVSGDTQALLPEDIKSWLVPRGHHLVKGRNQPVEVFSCGFNTSNIKLLSRSI
uniref:Guanylate cyclase domain-containing protein n=2 Tax=Ditylum brightwellii TaxID=49249 RepID=A0A7S2ELD5_9STRA|mmetsp:Transcript_35140/g.52469  ORF Transcript_35140/g.52469 Transcript_35140/m.52469 type:complete len:549 (+) Transcript_35140:129-1775(+)